MEKGFENSTNKKIYNLRKRKKVSEGKMAEILGLNRSTYRYHEQVSHFTPEQIEKIADFFGVTVKSLENDQIDFSQKNSISRLSDVKDFHLLVGNTLIPSDLVMMMENLSKLSEEKKKQLLDILDLLLIAEDEKIETVKSYIEFLNS